MFYSQPYVLFISILLVLSLFQMFLKVSEHSNKTINQIAGLLFILFFGFRGLVGWDWYNYYPYFNDAPLLNQVSFLDSHFEVGFQLYVSLIKSIFPDYHFFLFVNTIVDFVIINIFLKRNVPSYLYVLSLVFFISIEGSVMEINLLRNIKGLMFFLLSINCIEKRLIFRYFLLNLIGLSFHWSSIIFFPLYFILNKRISLRLFLILFVVGNIIYLLQFHYIQPIVKFVSVYFGEVAQQKTNLYLTSSAYSKQYGITIGYIERVFTTSLIMLYYNKISTNRNNILFLNSFIIYILSFLYFNESNILITRIANLFIFSYWILWPTLIDFNKSASRYLLFFMMSIYMNLRLIRQTNTILYQYDNVLYKAMSYKERKLIFDKNAHLLLNK